MPRRRSKASGRRAPSASYRETIVFTGVLSPASRAQVFKSEFYPLTRDRVFRLSKIQVEVAANDVATANALVVGSSVVQPALGDGWKGFISSRPPVIVGLQPRRFTMGPGPWVGTASPDEAILFELACICPKKGWEVGVMYVINITLDVKPGFLASSCKEMRHVPLDQNGDWHELP